MLAPRQAALIRGILQSTFALLAAASFGGWVVGLGMFIGNTVDMAMLMTAFWIISALYSLLALAVGAAMGRRQGERGLAAAVLGALLTWGILEIFFLLYHIDSIEMRVPFVMGLAMTAIGALISTLRDEDREGLLTELEEGMAELQRDEDNAPPPPMVACVSSQTGGENHGTMS
jgi:hypothetical protein